MRTLLVIDRKTGETERIREGDGNFHASIALAADKSGMSYTAAMAMLESGGDLGTAEFLRRFDTTAQPPEPPRPPLEPLLTEAQIAALECEAASIRAVAAMKLIVGRRVRVYSSWNGTIETYCAVPLDGTVCVKPENPGNLMPEWQRKIDGKNGWISVPVRALRAYE